jgi:hypothetical protein
MRLLRAAAPLIIGVSGLTVAGSASLGCLDLTQTSADDAGTATTDGGAAAEAGIVGGGCGVEQSSGIELCAATSMCPTVVVDTQAMPTCGFRVRGAVVDLVCACGTAICPVGAFATCAEASQLLTNQTAQGVCVQVAEGRCLEAAGTSSSSSSSSSGGNPACDRQCMQDCGGGAGCASVCNCD